MKYAILYITLLIAFLSGCSQQQSASNKLLDEVENIIEVNPDSASTILKNISDPENLDDKTFARWCMLSGKVTDKIFNTMLPTYHFERAYEWYATNGKPEEQVQIMIYLGRSIFSEGDYDKAMSIYTDALAIAEKNELNNLAGYTYSYMGDLYREKFMQTEAIKKYEMAAEFFKKEDNIDSYVYALRDLGREYVGIDSLLHALDIFTIADSVAHSTNNIEVIASINNALGNLYATEAKYDLAEAYFLKAIDGKEKMPDYLALVDLYIASDSIKKAKKILSQISQNDPKYTFSIKYLYYQIYKEEKNYKEALINLQDYVSITDSIIYADNQSKIFDIESKYNNLKISKEIDKLKIRQQRNIIITIISITALLILTIIYLLYRKKVTEKIQKQREELNKMKTDILYMSIDLEKKKELLNSYKERNENYEKMEEEIKQLTNKYRELQNKSLKNSLLIKELQQLANQSKPGNEKPLINDKQWKLITEEITHLYPNLHKYLNNLYPNLPEPDFQYCCLYMCGFDTNTEAKLLYISTDSVRKKRLRLRKKLNITLPKNYSSLYEYLVENIQ